MATNCPCPDPNSEPDDLCCPDTIEVADAIDVRDRSCKKRRIKPSGGKGILAVTKVDKWRQSDGSSDQPVLMNIEQVVATPGCAIVQDISGRILGVVPVPTGSELLRFVYDGGELKFVPDASTNQELDDSAITVVKKAVLAAFVCAGDGKVKIGKWLPDCITEPGAKRYVTVDENGEVECDTQDVGQCPDVEAVEELDSIWGCFEGNFSPILPVLNKILIGAGDPVKWTLADNISAFTTVARTSIYSQSYSVADIGALHSDNVDITSLPSYNAAFTYAMLHFVYRCQVSTSDLTHELAVDGRRFCGVNLISGSFQGENNHNSALVEIPDSKIWNITNTRTFWQPGSTSGNHWIDVYIDGWVK